MSRNIDNFFQKHIINGLKAISTNIEISENFDQGSYSNVTISGSSVRITPISEVNPTPYWNWYALKITKPTNFAPHFYISKAGYYTGDPTNMHFCYWSNAIDTDVWYPFDNFVNGNSEFEFWNNTAFNSFPVYVSYNRMYPVSRTLRKLQEWSTFSIVGDTATSVNKILGTTTPRVSLSGKSIPALPIYAFKISKSSNVKKNKLVLASGQHAGETSGRFALEGAVDWLLGGSADSSEFLKWFDVFVYPAMNPQGIYAGMPRNTVQFPNVEMNLHWDSTPGTYEEIDILNNAFSSDIGTNVDAVIDFHSYLSSGNIPLADVQDSSNTNYVLWNTAYKQYDTGLATLQENLPHAFDRVFSTVRGSLLSITLEQEQSKNRTISLQKASGVNSIKACLNLLQRNAFRYGSGDGYTSFVPGNSKISYPSPFSYNNATDAFSFSTWFMLDADSNNFIFFEKETSNGLHGMYVWSSGTTRGISFTMEGTAGEYRTTASNIFQKNVWNHLAITFSGGAYTNIHTYINGTESATYPSGQTGSGYYAPYDGPIKISSYHGGSNTFTGKLADMGMWYGLVISASTISSLAAGQSPITFPTNLVFYDSFNNAYPKNWVTGALGTVSGSQIGVSTGAGNGPGIIYETATSQGSFDFNGSTDRIDWSSPRTLDSGSPITISMWVRPDRITTNNQIMFDASVNNGNEQGLYLSNPGNVGSGAISLTLGGSTPGFRTSSNNALVISTWNHVLATWDGNTNMTGVHIYVNGVETTYQAIQAAVSPNSASGLWSVGGAINSDTYNFDGKIAQVAVWDSVLNLNAIYSLAQRRSPDVVYTTGLKFYFKGNTSDLHESVSNLLGVADGTTSVTGFNNGPRISYT